jgi:hypothetical protein
VEIAFWPDSATEFRPPRPVSSIPPMLAVELPIEAVLRWVLPEEGMDCTESLRGNGNCDTEAMDEGDAKVSSKPRLFSEDILSREYLMAGNAWGGGRAHQLDLMNRNSMNINK